MKWRNKYGKQEDEAKLRKPWEERFTSKFAWLPVSVDGTTVWFEKYYVWETWGPVCKEWILQRISLHDGSY